MPLAARGQPEKTVHLLNAKEITHENKPINKEESSEERARRQNMNIRDEGEGQAVDGGAGQVQNQGGQEDFKLFIKSQPRFANGKVANGNTESKPIR